VANEPRALVESFNRCFDYIYVATFSVNEVVIKHAPHVISFFLHRISVYFKLQKLEKKICTS